MHASLIKSLVELRSPAAPAAAARAAPVALVRDVRALVDFVPAWEELAAQALEPNVFYEHWMLLPALGAFRAGSDTCVALVPTPRAGARRDAGTLGAVVPLTFVPHWRRLNVSAVRLWQHPHCYLCAPLLRADCAAESLAALLEWLRRLGRATLLELPGIPAEGPFHDLLLDCCKQLGLATWRTESYTRGLWRQSTGGSDPGPAVSGALRRRLRRHERRLCEQGRLEHVAPRPGDDIGRWIDEFLALEASGWKGASGSALACSEPGRRYFTRIVTEAFRRQRLSMLGLDYDGRPIARRCAFLAGDGAFAFKTAYDERFAAYSPGAILEIDNLTQLMALPQVRWMDSCAAPDNLLVNRIANARRAICDLAIAVSPLGKLALTALRLLRWTTRRYLRRISPDIPTTTGVKDHVCSQPLS